MVTVEDIAAARERGKQAVLTTPVLPSHSFSAMARREVWLKAENLQRTGSFKIRGAMNALSLLPDDVKSRGVVAASAGNHAQGVALAAQTLGIAATVFMPRAAAIPKVAATRDYGADVGEEVVRDIEIKQHFARSMSLADAMSPNNVLTMIGNTHTRKAVIIFDR